MNHTYIAHFGVPKMKKGVRRYQYEDGSLTPLGREHYGVGDPRDESDVNVRIERERTRLASERARYERELAEARYNNDMNDRYNSNVTPNDVQNTKQQDDGNKWMKKALIAGGVLAAVSVGVIATKNKDEISSFIKKAVNGGKEVTNKVSEKSSEVKDKASKTSGVVKSVAKDLKTGNGKSGSRGKGNKANNTPTNPQPSNGYDKDGNPLSRVSDDEIHRAHVKAFRTNYGDRWTKNSAKASSIMSKNYSMTPLSDIYSSSTASTGKSYIDKLFK